LKNPTWVTFIGVTGMIFGGLGVWSGSQCDSHAIIWICRPLGVGVGAV